MKLLLVEDKPRIRQTVIDGLAEDGFEVSVASSAEQAMEALGTSRMIDAFLIDVQLPGLSGLEFCRWLRNLGRKEPVILLTAKDNLTEMVAGFDAGADDCLTKPFQIEVLRAKFRAWSRKAQGYPREDLVVADLTLNPNTMQVFRAGVEIFLSKKETLLLEYLMRNQDRVVTRSMIADAVWENETNQYTNIIDVFVNRIRKKIDGNPEVGFKLLHTVRRQGFRLSATPNPSEE